jgi:PmbA protein
MEERTAQQALAMALDGGASAAEIFLRESAATTVEVKGGAVDAFERARDIGAGIRVIVSGRPGFAYTTDLSETGIRAAVSSALGGARSTAPDPFQDLPARSEKPYPVVEMYDPEIVSLKGPEKIARVTAMEREAFAADRRVRRIRKASASFSEASTIIANTAGMQAASRGTVVSASIEVVAEDQGEAQAGWEHSVKRFYRDIDIEAVGRLAARKALALLGARHITSTRAPIVLDPDVAQEFIDILRSGFSAENVQKGKSLFAGKLGSEVASSLVTLYDDGLLERGIGTAPMDDEGVPMQKKAVIDQGRLVQFLYNSRSAKKDGARSTGNAVRGGFKSPPGVGVTNLYVQPGTVSPEDLLASTERGL